MSGTQKSVPLDSFVELRLEKVASYKDPQLPYVGLEHLAAGRPKLLGTLPSSASVSINGVFAQDDILFGKLRPNLRKSLRTPFPGYCSTDILVLRARDGIRPDFAGHLFQWEPIFASAAASAAGTKMPRTSWAELKRYTVRQPESEAEQARIAAVLDTADEAIAKTEAVIAKLRQVRTGLIHDLLSCGLDENGHLRDPISHPERFKDSPLGRVPIPWTVKTLGSICRPQQWPTISTPQLTPIGFPVFGANGQIGYYTHFNHEHPTVAITCRGATCGNIHITPPCCYITGNAMALDDLILSEIRVAFLAEFLRKRGMNDCITGSAQPQIIRSSLLGMFVPVPPAPEQDAVIEILALQDGLLREHEAELIKLQSVKSGLMDDLLTGRVRVPEGL